MSFSSISRGVLVVFLWGYRRFLVVFYESRVGFSWISYAVRVNCLCSFSVNLADILYACCGFLVGFLWISCGLLVNFL